MTKRMQINLRLKPTASQQAQLNIIPFKTRVLVSEAQLSKKEAEEIMSLSISQNKQIFQFDNVFGDSTEQHEIYKTAIEPIIFKATNEFKNACIILMGTTGSGKSFTLRGGEGNQKGLILRSVDAILKLCQTYNYTLNGSGISIQYNGNIDLLTGQSVQISDELKSTQIEDIGMMHSFLRQTLKFRDKKAKNKIHYCVQVNICRNNSSQSSLCRIDFIELAGIEILQKQGKYSLEEKTFAQQSFSQLANFFESGGQSQNSSSLTKYLSPVLTNNSCIICCTTNEQEDFVYNQNAIQLACQIKSSILKQNEILTLTEELSNLRSEIENSEVPSDENQLSN